MGGVRRGLQMVGVLSAGGTWVALCGWQGWALDEAATATALAAGALALGLGFAARFGRLGRDWVGGWSALAAAGLGFAAVALGDTVRVDRSPAGAALAAGLAFAAIGTGVAAAPLGQAWLRETAAVLVAAAGGALAYGLDATAGQSVVGIAIAGAIATLMVVAVTWSGRAVEWIRPGLVLASIAAVAAVAIALGALPDRSLLVAALLVAGLDSAALGLVGGRRPFLVASPVLLCLAWLAFASEALTGNPQWFTAPIGLTVLAVVGMARWDRHRAGRERSTPTLVALEYFGVLFVVGPATVAIVADNLAYALLAIAEGVLITAWGVLTRVRRRALCGIVVVVAAAVLFVVVPLAGLVPKVRGPALWLAIAAVGVVAILVAAFLEQGRSLTRRGVQQLRELTADWE